MIGYIGFSVGGSINPPFKEPAHELLYVAQEMGALLMAGHITLKAQDDRADAPRISDADGFRDRRAYRALSSTVLHTNGNNLLELHRSLSQIVELTGELPSSPLTSLRLVEQTGMHVVGALEAFLAVKQAENAWTDACRLIFDKLHQESKRLVIRTRIFIVHIESELDASRADVEVSTHAAGGSEEEEDYLWQVLMPAQAVAGTVDSAAGDRLREISAKTRDALGTLGEVAKLCKRASEGVPEGVMRMHTDALGSWSMSILDEAAKFHSVVSGIARSFTAESKND